MISLFKFKPSDGNLNDGIVQYLIRRNGNIPKFSDNGESEHPNAKVVYTHNYSYYFDNSGNPVYLDIDLKKFKVSVTGYKIFIRKGNTPPTKWELYGRNDEENEWALIHAQDPIYDICPEGIDQEFSSQCNDDFLYTHGFSYPIGPFRYFRYSVLESRASMSTGHPNGFMRLGKLDFYGSLWNSHIITPNQNPFIFFKGFICMIFILVMK